MVKSGHYSELSCKTTMHATYRFCEICVLHNSAHFSTPVIIEMITWLWVYSAKQYLKVLCSGVVSFSLVF